MKHLTLAGLCLGGLLASSAALAAPTSILFVGNSYTFGRLDPVMSYNWANVHDLTAPFQALYSGGSNAWEPHPWGGVPGIFKQFTVQAGLDYDVSISARNAASLRGQFLNTASPLWDLRGNVASKKWDTVVLQEQSDAALPNGMGKNANQATFNAYADQFERFIHNGAAQTYTESALFGSQAKCVATGLSTGSCNTSRVIPANANASAATKVYLLETWARPDMVFAHKITKADVTHPDGSPIVDTSAAGGAATLYYGSLAAMTADLKTSFLAKAASNPGFAGVIPAGEAFQMAIDLGLAKSGGFYDANGVYTQAQAGDLMNLWWNDYLHASKYGSYLSALVQFGSITGLDPNSLGANEIAAVDLGISKADALTLQHIASAQLGFPAPVPEPATWAMALLGLGALAYKRRRQA
ncbi:MAG: PEP-CTERM sorting domain-containing protein [Burkholderiaceae bacterium]|nr:PEP-CTERM sorting domain-containing protein [Burkholderiaceae bacterium]